MWEDEATASEDLGQRVRMLVRDWKLTVDSTSETDSSFFVFGTRGHHPVVLKVVKQEGDEWHCGEVLAAFEGSGIVRVYEHIPGAALLERTIPGDPLVSMAMREQDEEATVILASVIERMAGHVPPRRCATVHDWARGFDDYLAADDEQIPAELVQEAQRCYAQLANSQGNSMLLHGDLQHYNVLRDVRRGWLAIDPKGVVGEIEYEIGAVLRNPIERPDLFVSAKIIERRLDCFARLLNLDAERALRWSFAQAVLSAIWEVEDGFRIDPSDPVLTLAKAFRGMLA